MSAGKSRVLAATVHVDGQVYVAGTEVPTDVAEQITNPKAWGEAPAESTSSGAGNPTASESGGKSGKKSGGKKDKAQAEASTASDEGGLKPPSKVSGSTVAWRDYALAAAAGQNIDVPEGSKRSDIIAALDGAGISTGG